MPNTTWLITDASRGLGLETVRQLRQLLQTPTNTVFGTCRSPSTATELAALVSSPGTLYIVKLDVTDEASIKAAANEVCKLLNGAGLDYVLNNAGINRGDDLAFNFTPSALSDMMATNALGPALVSRYLLPAIERSDRRVIMNMTSRLASIGSDYGTIDACYCMSKIALNMLTYKQARQHPDLIPIVLEPGWVKIDMGGPGAKIEPAESVAGTLKVLRSLTKESAGKFFNYEGNKVFW